jgi:hypothetical protein
VSEVTQDAPEPPFWIRWPVWVIAVVVFLPLRLIWELLRLVGRLLKRYAGRPLAWCWREVVVALVWRYCVVPPFRMLRDVLGVVSALLERLFAWCWRQVLAGAFLGRYAIRPLAWLWQHVIAWVWQYLVVRPFWFLFRYLVIVPLEWLWPRLVVAPVLALNRMIAWFVRVSAPWRQALAHGFAWLLRGIVRWVLWPGWRGAAAILVLIRQWLLRPMASAVASVWRWTVLPVWRVATAGARWLRESVLAPATVVVKNLFAAFRR